MSDRSVLDTPLDRASSNYTLSAFRLFQVSLACLIILVLFILATWNSPEPDLIFVQLTGFSFFLICLLSLAGTVLGVLSFRKKEPAGFRKKLGLFGNGVLFLAFLILILYSLIAFPVSEIEH